MTQKQAIDNLLDATPQLWKCGRSNRGQRSLSTGHARLDAHLPGNGWPLGAVSELITGKPGLGELSLLLPALVDIAGRDQWVILVDPPWVPYPPALLGRGLLLDRLLLIRTHSGRDSLWACEQALRNGRGGAVVAWPERIGFARLRRLQLSAGAHAKLAFLFRPESAVCEPSPAALRLQIAPGDRRGVRIDILKCRGSRPSGSLWIRQPHLERQDSREANLRTALRREIATGAEISGTPPQLPAPTTVN